MTEAEWLSAADPMRMLASLGELRERFPGRWVRVRFEPTPRKLRLMDCAFGRRVWNHLRELGDRRAVEVTEAIADGAAAVADRDTALAEAVSTLARTIVGFAHTRRPSSAHFYAALSTGGHHNPVERTAQCDIIRDVLGNPFRPVRFDPEWRTTTAVGLAAAMYESRDFGAMPILADALEDAGCDSADVLAHCRGEGPHVRGCWVVDLVLGKS